MAIISFRFRVSVRSEKYSNHSAVRLHRSEFETTLNSRKTGISATSHSDPASKVGHGNCMVRHQIASSVVVVGGLVCANVSGLFVETSSWP
jgi:hypothetical protein